MSEIKGITFDNQVFTAKDDGALNENMLADGVISGCGVTYNGANIVIAAGNFILAGRLCSIPSAIILATESPYENGYGRVKVSIDLSQPATTDDFGQAVLSVEYSSADEFPVLVTGNINTGNATLYESEFVVVRFGAYMVSAIVRYLTATQVKATQRIQVEDTTVPTTAFVADTTYADYPYRAAVPITGVLASMTPEVTFGVVDALSGIFAPVSECYAGGVYIYAAEVPAADVIIPTVIVWKAVT